VRIVRNRLVADDGAALPYRRSPNQSPGLEPSYVVMHYTAGASAESSIDWLTNPAAQASAHIVVARDGSITQLVAFDRQAWHAGRSEWQGVEGLNAYSFGIELDNGGPLQRRVDAAWYTPFGLRIPDEEVVEGSHRDGGPPSGWHSFSTEQLLAAADVANLLVRHFGLLDVIGHDDIASGRKRDPGPAFPMQTFRARVLGRGDGNDPSPQLAQTTSALNIRVGPGTHFEKLPASPLPAGTKVSLLAEDGAWRQVLVLDLLGGEMDVEGWVHGRYLQPLPPA
jgi:N-acetylmuramoyl-L-alanine amidase